MGAVELVVGAGAAVVTGAVVVGGMDDNAVVDDEPVAVTQEAKATKRSARRVLTIILA
jgi:hypothetical protein